MTGILFGFFLFTVLSIVAAGYAFVLRPSRSGNVEIPEAIAKDARDLPAIQAAIVGIFRAIGEIAPGSSGQKDHVRKMLTAAGYRWESSVNIYSGIRAASTLMLAAFCVWLAATFRGPEAPLALPALCGMGFGYLLPDRVLERIAKARERKLRRGLPAALDLMVLALEAGQNLDSAIAQAARGLRLTHPELASDFTQLHLELRANASREEALKNFATRGRDPEICKLASLLLDTDRFGGAIAPALRTHAIYLRQRFRQLSQELGRKVGVKLVFPVFFLIFPSVVLVTLGPAVILIMGQMKTLLGR